MDTCIFCKIIKKEIPCHEIQETPFSLSFLDIHPHAQGHTVVIPKSHAKILFELDDKTTHELLTDVKKTMKLIQDKLHPDGFNVGWNDGPTAGQTVGHLHIHIMPRYTGDNGGSMHSIIKNAGKLSVEEIAKKFQ
ncbi:HIT domain-containing protein [Candidatus Woesearchaeota archaeon]|nr:HIT domain-containing protein [Candidatus Woesearchaeota archaeon]